MNEAIRANQLRVISEDGKQLGILSRADALRLAEEQELDLVEISPDADPPVVKIIDWGKYNYQRTKQLQKNRRHAKDQEVRQIRMGLKISDHDLGVKLKKANDLLAEGHKVKITLFYRGRELAHKDLGFRLADKIIAQLGETIALDQQPQLAGKQLSFMVRGVPAKNHKETMDKPDIIKESLSATKKS